MKLEVKGLIESSLLDWDGKIVSTIFLPGCNFRCPYCYNHKLVLAPKKMRTIPLNRIKRHLLKHGDFIDGVCITGGEPTIHKDLPELLREIKGLGFLVKLDTNGSNPEMLQHLIDERLVDYIAMDLKAPLKFAKYKKATNKNPNLKNLKKSINIIMSSGIGYEFRTTVVPTIVELDDIPEIGKAVKGAKRIVFQQFVPKDAMNNKLREIKPYNREDVERFAAKALKYVHDLRIRGQ
ncbi:MAG: anaerobic ribonucleoside-triphosphate reductase activating protein [Thermoplasmata archaeon]